MTVPRTDTPSAAIVVRSAGVADVPALAPLFRAYRAFHGIASEVAECRDFLEARIGRGELAVFAAEARTAAAIELCAFTQLYPTFSSLSACRVWVLNDPFVDPRYRGLGIGRRLTSRAADHARATGASVRTASPVTRAGSRGLAALVALFPLVAFLRVPTGAPAPPPAEQPSPIPGARNAHAMAYDAGRDRVVLFGGADDARVLADTWELDGERWRRVADDGPGPRTFPNLVYHSGRGTVMLFGGNRVLFGSGAPSRATLLGDLWEWDGERWSRLDATGPAPRAESAMAYDPVRDRLVLFGGWTIDSLGARHRLADIWEWDGHRWTEIAAPGPAARSGSAMVYDHVRRSALLFGGSTGRPSGETWLWDGRRWERLPHGAPARFNPSMASDASGRRVLVFGGWNGSTRIAELAALGDDGAWTAIPGGGPSPRNHAALAYDEARRRLLLLGGHDGERVFGDVWAYDGRSWRELGSIPPRRRVDNGH